MSFHSERGEEAALLKGMATAAKTAPRGSVESSDDSADERSKSSARQGFSMHANDPRERKRQLNRQSKTRCRQRRIDRIKKLEVDISRLSAEQKTLQYENEQLRQEFDQCYRGHKQQQARKAEQIAVAAIHQTINTNLHETNPILALLQIQASMNLLNQWDNSQGGFSVTPKGWK